MNFYLKSIFKLGSTTHIEFFLFVSDFMGSILVLLSLKKMNLRDISLISLEMYLQRELVKIRTISHGWDRLGGTHLGFKGGEKIKEKGKK